MYLSGGIPRALWENPHPRIGVVLTPAKTNHRYAGVLAWAADNECFAQGKAFDGERWLRWLASMTAHRARCLFAVCPDVVGDATATLDRSAAYLGRIEQLGFVPAYVSQDGADRLHVPWHRIGWLFVGGTDAWKLSERSWALCAEARARGKQVHVGRVNSWRRLRACRAALVDSVDGTQLAYRPDQTLPQLIRWLDAVNGQGVLEVAS